MLKVIKIIGIVAVVVVVSIFSVNIFSPKIVREKIMTYVHENCASCVLDIETIRVDGFSATITLKKIKFSGGNPKATAVEAQIPKLKLEFALSGFFKSIVHVDEISVDHPEIKIIEGDLKARSKKSKEEKTIEFLVDEIELDNGTFTYVREHNGKLAPIHVTNIDIEVDKFGSTKEMRDKPIEGEVTALLEETGKVKIKVATYLFKTPLDTKVNLGLDQFDLSKMNTYFETNDGIKLKGQLVHADSEVVIKGDQLFSNVEAEYTKLDVEFKKNSERTALGAFFSTLLADLQMQSKNTDVEAKKQIQSAEIKREPQEAIIGFIFRGMKEAALLVASKKEPKK